MRTPVEVAGMLRHLARLPEHVQQREELEEVAHLVEERPPVRPLFGCCHCEQQPVALQEVISREGTDSVALRLGLLPVGWEIRAQLDGRAFMVECPTCAAIRHARPPASPEWIVQPEGKAYEIELGRMTGRRLHPLELAILRSAAGRDLLQRLEWLELRDAERATATPERRLELAEQDARRANAEVERLGGPAAPGEQPVQILTRLEDHLEFLKWLLAYPGAFAAAAAGVLNPRELVARHERRNDPPATPAGQGG